MTRVDREQPSGRTQGRTCKADVIESFINVMELCHLLNKNVYSYDFEELWKNGNLSKFLCVKDLQDRVVHT